MGSVWVPGVSLPLWPPQNKNVCPTLASRLGQHLLSAWVGSVLCSGCLQCLSFCCALPKQVFGVFLVLAD